jgi:hypothetical protein
MEDQISMAFLDVMDQVISILVAKEAVLHRHDNRSIIGAMSTVIMKQLILNCGTTTSMTIVCTPIILPPEVLYAEDQIILKLLLLMIIGSGMLFGVIGSNNDINVLNQSLLFIDVVKGHTPEVSFIINGREHHMGYYLTNGIYPSQPMFMKGMSVPQQEKHRFFSAKQSTLKKDVECTFDLVKKRFNILAIPGRSYSQHTLGLIMHACIILHNMIINDERDGGYDENYHTITFIVAPAVNYEAPASLTSILQRQAHLTTGLIFLNL